MTLTSALVMHTNGRMVVDNRKSIYIYFMHQVYKLSNVVINS